MSPTSLASSAADVGTTGGPATSSLTGGWDQVTAFLPKLGGFLVVIAVTFVVGWLVRRHLGRLLHGVGVDRLASRTPLTRPLARTGLRASELLVRLASYLVWLVGLSAAFGVFGPNPISDYLHAIVSYLPKVAVAVVILGVTGWLAGSARSLLRDVLAGLPYAGLAAGVAAWLVAGFGVVAALHQLDIAPPIVTALVYAVLACVVGVIVVGVGGGLVGPMQGRWEQLLRAVESEAPAVRERARAWRLRRAAEADAAAPYPVEAAPPYPAEAAVPVPAPAVEDEPSAP